MINIVKLSIIDKKATVNLSIALKVSLSISSSTLQCAVIK